MAQTPEQGISCSRYSWRQSAEARRSPPSREREKLCPVHRDLGTSSLFCGRAALRLAKDPHIWPVTQHFGCFDWL